jgi:hypothetical protein
MLLDSKAVHRGLAAVVAAGSALVAHSAPAIPDPCKLVTAAEIEQIAGPVTGWPVAGDIAAGDVSCEFNLPKGPRWINVRLHDGDLVSWKGRNGGKSPVALPEFGKDAFANPDFDGSADLYAQKGALILRVSLPNGPQALDLAKAIAKKALSRL